MKKNYEQNLKKDKLVYTDSETAESELSTVKTDKYYKPKNERK